MAITDNPKVTVTASYRILKFAEGANPEIDTPFDVIEKQEIFEGEEAVKILETVNGGITNAND